MEAGPRLTSVRPWKPAESLCVNGTNLLFYRLCLGLSKESGEDAARI